MTSEEPKDHPGKPELLSYYIRQDEWRPTIPRGPVAAMYNSPGPAIVRLKPLVGETSFGERHDITRTKAPAYKMGIKFDISKSDIGPGPGAYDIRGWTNQGIDRCKAPFFGIKTAAGRIARTPGPADYTPGECDDAVYHRAPIYSMGTKLKESKLFVTPAPNAYTLPSVLGLANTPYANRAPGYSMRIKPGDPKFMEGPGPAAYMLPSTNLYREKPPAFTVPKAEKPKISSRTPGPLDYSTELVNFDKYSTPKITFGIRHSPYKAFPGFAAEK